MSLDPRVDIGHVHLKVADIDRSLGFYRDILGFDVMQRHGDEAAFISAGGYHHHLGLNTWESRGASPPPPNTTGLYHVAIRYPDRAQLGNALKRLVQAKWPVDGATDHGVSEAIYLRDPDGNGIELYRDRPLPRRDPLSGPRAARQRAQATRPGELAGRRGDRPRRLRGDLPPRPGRERDRALPRPAGGGVAAAGRRRRRGDAQCAARPAGAAERGGLMAKGYAEGPAAEEAERRLEELERGGDGPEPELRLAVYGSTEGEPERHFLGWRDEVDPDQLFASGEAWGITVVRATV